MSSNDLSFVNVRKIELSEVDFIENSAEQDPLACIGKEVSQPIYYKVKDKVFSEPFNISNEEISEEVKNDSRKQEEFLFIDNVIVKKEHGKRNKYIVNVHHLTGLTCPQSNCGRKFSDSTLLKAHIRKVHCSELNHTCEVCGKTFKARYLLTRHAVTHKNTTRQCPVCKKELSFRTNLSTHMRMHTNIRSHACDACGKRFARASTLATHVQFLHRDGDIVCKICGLRFATRKQWSSHRSCQTVS